MVSAIGVLAGALLLIMPPVPAGAQAPDPAQAQGGPSPGAAPPGPGMMGPGGMMGHGGMMGQGGMGPGMMGQRGMGPGGGWRRGMRGDLAFDEHPLITIMLHHRSQLGLTDEQVEQLRALRSNFEKEAIRTGADLRILELELDDLLDAEQVDLAKVEAMVRKEEATRASLRLSRIRAIEQAKTALTAEQRQRLRSAVEAWEGPGAGPMGPGMRGPGPIGPGGRSGMVHPGLGGGGGAPGPRR